MSINIEGAELTLRLPQLEEIKTGLTRIEEVLQGMAMNQDQDFQAVVGQLQQITADLTNQDTRIETAVRGLHDQIDTLVGQQVTPATAQALKDAVAALGTTATGFGQIEAPAPTGP